MTTATATAAASASATATTDERALAALQREHGAALLHFLLGLTYGDRQRAEDLLQETLVRAWQHPEAFAAPFESMRPWLFTVGHAAGDRRAGPGWRAPRRSVTRSWPRPPIRGTRRSARSPGSTYGRRYGR